MRFGPTEADADTQGAHLGGIVDSAGVPGYVEAGDPDGAAGTGHLHQRVEDSGGDFVVRRVPMPPSLETYTVNCRVDLRLADYLLDLVSYGRCRYVYRLAAEAPGLGEALGNPVAHDNDRCAQKVTRGRAGQPHGAPASDVDDRARANPSRDGPMETGREYVGKAREIPDLCHRLVFVRKTEEVEVGVGDHHELSLAPHPAAHVDITVGGAGTSRVHVQADPRLSLLAVAAAAAGDIERDRDQVANFHELHVPARFYDLSSDLVAEYQACGRCRPSPHHVLVGTANIRAYDLQYHAMVTAAGPEREHREIDRLQLDLTGADIRDTLIALH